MTIFNYAACMLLMIAMSSCSHKEKEGRNPSSGTLNAQIKADPDMTKIRQKANSLTENWPQSSVSAATEMIYKYGDPSKKADMTLEWRNVAPFEKIIVHREVHSSKFPVLHQNAIDHIVAYKAPAQKLEEVRKFNRDIVIDSYAGTMTASGKDEAMNILSLNLAHEVIQERMSAIEAREKCWQETLKLLDGQKTVYTQTLTFGKKVDTADLGMSPTNKMRWNYPEKTTEKQSQEDESIFEKDNE